MEKASLPVVTEPTGSRGKSSGDGKLSPLQRALFNSVLGNRIKLVPDSTSGDFVSAAKQKWTRRIIPDIIPQFLQDNLAAGAVILKGKEAHCSLFWTTLAAMD